jgi:hypothetical protein
MRTVGFDKLFIEEHLTRCPFCGQEARARAMESLSQREVMIGCFDNMSICKVRPLVYGKLEETKSLVIAWNTRAPIPQIPQTRLKPPRDSESAEASTPVSIRNSHGGERIPGSSGGISGQDLPSRSEERKREFRRITNEISQRLARLADNYCADDRTSTGGD